MGLTTDQWYDKLKSWVPSWYFEGDEQQVCFSRGVFKGFAAILSQVQEDCDDQQASTFIMNDKDIAPIIDLHGAERNQPRNGELDAPYKIRIRDSLFKHMDESALADSINAQLESGTVTMIENSQNGFFDDDISTAIFFDDSADNSRWLDSHKWYNWWTAIIPLQPDADRDTIFANVIAAIEANKAYGTTYDILYNQDAFMVSEEGDQLVDEEGTELLITEETE